MAKILMVGGDAAQSRAFVRLKPVLEERGHIVNLMVGDGQPLTQSEEEIVGGVADADLVLVGMSSAPGTAQPEVIAAEMAYSLAIPCVFYGDSEGCWGRARKGAWFEEVARNAWMYMGASEEDAQAAREVFPKAKLIGTGNPVRELAFFPEMSRGEVRAELGVSDDEILVLAPGGRYEGGGDIALWNTVMEALAILPKKGIRFKLIMTPHPGDKNLRLVDPKDDNKQITMYQDLARLSPVPAELVLKSRLSTSQIVAGADIVVGFADSATGVDAACQRKPSIVVGLGILWNYLEAANGTTHLEWVKNQTSRVVLGYPDTLARAIERLLTPGGYAYQRSQQEACYPLPERGLALRKMVEALETVLSGKK